MSAQHAKKTIGIYVPCEGHGGPSRYVDSLLSGLCSEVGFDVTVFGHHAGPYRDRSGITFVPIHEDGLDLPKTDEGQVPTEEQVPARGLTRLWRSRAPVSLKYWAGTVRECRSLVRLFRRHRVDLLHTNNTGCEESAVAARLAGCRRVVGTFHTDPTSDVRGARAGLRYRLLECVSNHCLDRAIAVSEMTKTIWSRRTLLPNDRVVTIHNGINLDTHRRRCDRDEARRGLGIPADAGLVIGCVGRLVELKGVKYLIEAVGTLSGQYSDLYVVLAGDGEERAALEAQVESLGLQGRVRFLGFCSDVQKVYDALDVFVLPSLSETLGYVHLEAMATELPTIGTQVGGVPEVIDPGKTGFLIPPGDTGALVAAIRELAESGDLRRRMGLAGRERVIQFFDERQMVRRTIDLYRSLLEERGAAAVGEIERRDRRPATSSEC